MQTLSKLPYLQIIYSMAILCTGYIAAKFISLNLAKLIGKHGTQHHAMIFKRIFFYFLFLLFLVAALQQLGFDLTVLLGAAGVFTVAISFASQTAASNLISGIFLIIEGPFKIGNIIQTKNFIGKVEAIDLLSTKIVTFDNQLVRLPNESLIKTEVINLSYFPTRRADILVGVAYGTDLDKAKSVLLTLANSSELSLNEPEPKVIVTQLADSSINLRLSVWSKTEDLAAIKNELQMRIQTQFEQNQIEIPFPQLSITVNQEHLS